MVSGLLKRGKGLSFLLSVASSPADGQWNLRFYLPPTPLTSSTTRLFCRRFWCIDLNGKSVGVLEEILFIGDSGFLRSWGQLGSILVQMQIWENCSLISSPQFAKEEINVFVFSGWEEVTHRLLSLAHFYTSHQASVKCLFKTQACSGRLGHWSREGDIFHPRVWN